MVHDPQRSGQPARDIDFIIPGNLTGARHGIHEAGTGACHLSRAQAKTWGRECFTPAVRAAAQRPEFMRILAPPPTPRRHLPTTTHRGPTNRCQRVRHKPEDAQRPLLVSDRGSTRTGDHDRLMSSGRQLVLRFRISAPASKHAPPSSPTMGPPTAARFARGLKATGDAPVGRRNSDHFDWSAGPMQLARVTKPRQSP